ncbi:uncharacterized protein CLUP02_13505 [Colletotrichum lupini]|uniref:Uncharacterized protein n=1 Tax=Colletotrichum lupini TaxID=145971 RepID=A0A9Q8WLQ9_9PEZI|nr:uncharacterized protein CLUP02_13505 [Colletotrichum lupini]UQC87984.1 hypothetical protein CLUP02_13505 [Colletotrichum lupini]
MESRNRWFGHLLQGDSFSSLDFSRLLVSFFIFLIKKPPKNGEGKGLVFVISFLPSPQFQKRKRGSRKRYIARRATGQAALIFVGGILFDALRDMGNQEDTQRERAARH